MMKVLVEMTVDADTEAQAREVVQEVIGRQTRCHETNPSAPVTEYLMVHAREVPR